MYNGATMRRKKERYKLNKIEIDEKTMEPKIVEVNPDRVDLEPDEYKDVAAEHEKLSEEEVKNQSKQLVMAKVFGINDDKQVDKRQKIFKNVFTAIFIILVVGVLAFTFYNDVKQSKTLYTFSFLRAITGRRISARF